MDLAENVGLRQRCEWVGAGMGLWQSWGIAFQVERASLQRGGPIWGRRSSQEATKGGSGSRKGEFLCGAGRLWRVLSEGLDSSEGRSRHVVRGGGAPRMEACTQDRVTAPFADCGVDWRAQFKVPKLQAADQ